MTCTIWESCLAQHAALIARRRDVLHRMRMTLDEQECRRLSYYERDLRDAIYG